MIELIRVDGTDLNEAMFLRPKNPDDHREFEILLPQLEPLYVYADIDGRDWVRWFISAEVAQRFGWGTMKCACCDSVGNPALGGFHVDTAYDEIDWYLQSAPRQF